MTDVYRIGFLFATLLPDLSAEGALPQWLTRSQSADPANLLGLDSFEDALHEEGQCLQG